MQRHLLMSKQLVLLNFHPTLLNPAHSQFHLAHPIQDGCSPLVMCDPISQGPLSLRNFCSSLPLVSTFMLFPRRIATSWFTLDFDKIQRYRIRLFIADMIRLAALARSKTEAARVKAAQEAYKELQNARQEALQKKKAERERC
ncbi:hypothetical protein QQP08_005794 [Theobroma cacao]|nr:hypothetical protein QQP08_005794 [Theobroma cacao]